MNIWLPHILHFYEAYMVPSMHEIYVCKIHVFYIYNDIKRS